MGRWEPDASGRLREAALELYAEQGFDRTTVAEIAERAGLTARTFFNHFSDKRDVLFAGNQELLDGLGQALDAAPATESPMSAVMTALDAAAAVIGSDRQRARRRRDVILANQELRERELAKLAAMGTTLAEGLARRGVPEPDARLTAEIGIAVAKVGIDRWTTSTDDEDLSSHIHATLADLQGLTTRRRSRTAGQT